MREVKQNISSFFYILEKQTISSEKQPQPVLVLNPGSYLLMRKSGERIGKLNIILGPIR